MIRRFFLIAIFSSVFAGMVPLNILASQKVVLAWNPSTNAEVVSYNVYYGTASHAYTQIVSLGNVASTEIFCVDDTTYFFAVTAVDSAGNESPLSEEVSYVVPPPLPTTLQTQTLSDANGQPYAMTISANSSETGWWEMDSSTNLQTWSVYKQGFGSEVSMIVPLNTQANPQMFFRLFYY